METNRNSERGPYLAFLEIKRRKLLFERGDANKLVDYLMQCFTRFGHLPCFASDVEVFLQALDSNRKNEFWKKLLKEQEATTLAPTKALGQSITVFKVQNMIGDVFSLPVAELKNMAIQMTQIFCKNLPLSKDLDAQENMHGEELLSMACNVLVQLFWRTRDLGYLVESIMILEFGLAVRSYKSLDVKNILLESVSHHILPQMLASPLWPDLNNLLNEYLRFMDDHIRESADFTFLAYRHRTYDIFIHKFCFSISER